MAERRMFAKAIIDSDAFLDMPNTTQLLYFHLSMRADDDGFINNTKSIMRNIGSKDDDLKILIAKKFIIPFESGLIVIKHWKIHNYIQNDRYKETKYLDEKKQLSLKENKAYSLNKSECIHNGYTLDTQVSIGKDSIGKSNTVTSRFIKPTVEEVKSYCLERKNNIDAQSFIDYYESKGWVIGKSPMKDWKAAVRTWERNKSQGQASKKSTLSREDEELIYKGVTRI